MDQDKTNIYLLSIVAAVAVIAIVVMVISSDPAAPSTEDSAGAAYEQVTLQEYENICGDDIAESIEECDGTDLRGNGCFNFGYESGELRCDQACNYDISECTLGY